MPRKARDLTGQRFGKLVAIEKVRVKGRTKWLFQCDCGTTKAIIPQHLETGVKSCGCLREDIWESQRQSRALRQKPNPKPRPKPKPKPRRGRQPQDLTGERFSKLVVKSLHIANKLGSRKWTCTCDCGSETVAWATQLRSGKKTSCGCATPPREPRYSANEGKCWKEMCCSETSKLPWKGMTRKQFIKAVGRCPDAIYDRIVPRDKTKPLKPGNTEWSGRRYTYSQVMESQREDAEREDRLHQEVLERIKNGTFEKRK